ncbi:MAG: TFIIB-type zinc ribbon-containing protein [Prosthecobacter sp.]
MDHLPIAIKCPNCAAATRENDYDQERGMVRCGYCGTLMIPQQGRTGPQGFRPRLPIPLPSGMKLENNPHGVIITRRWLHVMAIFLIPFCIVWDSFLVTWYSTVSDSGAPQIFSLFPLVHVAVGVGLTYYTLALLINRSRVEVTHGAVTVSHGPLPWNGWRQITAGMIDQLFCKEIIRRGKNGPTVTYEVWVALSDGTQSKLVGAGLEVEQALYIEQQIELQLNVKDKPMSSEVRR